MTRTRTVCSIAIALRSCSRRATAAAVSRQNLRAQERYYSSYDEPPRPPLRRVEADGPCA